MTSIGDSDTWTTRHVVERFIKPRTKKTMSRYCDALPEAVVSRPRFLVSHRWDSSFTDLVKQLKLHFRDQDPEQVFIFLDVFAIKQNKKAGQPVDPQMTEMFKVRRAAPSTSQPPLCQPPRGEERGSVHQSANPWFPVFLVVHN